ncbi:hypothetical protein SDC9_96115 [bioreactor metagenome]|uniref:Uncharacterized protein n=1 Tax=bioreactor metagenome TaxID=1076179 RepID=A0A645A8Z3_9ZZZZ
MCGRIDANARSSIIYEFRRKPPVCRARKLRVRKPRLRFKGVCLEPIHQRQIHAHAEHGILRRMQMHVRKALQNQPAAIVRKLRAGKFSGRFGKHAGNNTVYNGDVTILRDDGIAKFLCLDDISLY